MHRLPLLAAALALAACTTAQPAADASVPSAPGAFDPSAVDYDAVESLDYDQYVRPLLEARDVLAGAASAPVDYDLESVVMAGPSGFVVPFDAEDSLMLRFVRDLPETAAIPFPNLRDLEPDEVRFLARWIEAGAPGSDGHVPFMDARHLLFAGEQGQNTVAVIDAETLRLIRRIDFDDHGVPSAPYGPHHFVFEPDGSAAYVSLVSAGVVAKVALDLSMDPSDPAFLLGRTDGSFATPGMMSLDPSSDKIYVGRSTLSDPLANGFGVLDRETMEVETVATPFNVPHALAATPDGRYVLTAELTGTQETSRALVYDVETEDVAIVPLPSEGEPREFIHFSILGAHHMGGMSGHHLGDAGMAGYPYTVTLTSRSTDEVLFFTLTEDGDLTLEATAPAGDGPYHAHANHDGSALLIPDQRGDTVTILDEATRQPLALVEAAPLSQPHSPAPGPDGTRFFVTSSNLDGAWTPEFLFHGPDGEPQAASAFGNLAAFSPEGDLVGVVQLGAYPSGLEPVSLPATDMDHDGMDHGQMDHGDH
jgi:DNA-binding beta-propeller fold protein YncE